MSLRNENAMKLNHRVRNLDVNRMFSFVYANVIDVVRRPVPVVEKNHTHPIIGARIGDADVRVSGITLYTPRAIRIQIVCLHRQTRC
jgi:hypothetical protein